MTSIVDATDSNQNIPQKTPTTVTVVQAETHITDADPLAVAASNPSRTAQQHIVPSAINPRFTSLVGQYPAPVNQNSIQPVDVGAVRFVIGDGNTVIDNYHVISFQFTGTTQTYVDVKLSTSIFIDEVSFAGAYPFGSNIEPPNWAVERIDSAHFPPTFGPGTVQYNVNQANQYGEFLVIKNFTGVRHVVYVYYYARAIVNQGGTKATN